MGEPNQDHQLHQFLKNRQVCTIITTNGVPIKGTIEFFDKYIILLQSPSGKQSMIYKHALSTIIG
ncbi:RNA chaperone Hfq [Paenibacillus turpanensis]|uniref:RNA chaperone Hfq n=1 Tax=Paenibacillus turpanensis TaxID=2689078 RepID=UPI0014078450|nr:RNA chaperone Hfq [Paenibacillus turpanensis]